MIIVIIIICFSSSSSSSSGSSSGSSSSNGYLSGSPLDALKPWVWWSCWDLMGYLR